MRAKIEIIKPFNVENKAFGCFQKTVTSVPIFGEKIFKNNRGLQPSQKEAAASNFIRVSNSDPCQPNRPKPGCLLVLLLTTANHFESAGYIMESVIFCICKPLFIMASLPVLLYLNYFGATIHKYWL